MRHTMVNRATSRRRSCRWLSRSSVEEMCLFFVGLSRAKKELVLSYATHYGQSGYKPSSLLSVVEPFFARGDVPVLCWSEPGKEGAGTQLCDTLWSIGLQAVVAPV